MVVIRILDHIKTYSTYQDGLVIYDLIKSALDHEQPVVVSFTGIKSVSSAFINSAFIRLLESFEFDFIRAHLGFVDSTRQINRVIRDRFAFAVAKEDQMSASALSDGRSQSAA